MYKFPDLEKYVELLPLKHKLSLQDNVFNFAFHFNARLYWTCVMQITIKMNK